MYIFDVVEVVPHPGDPGAKFRLRLVCKDDCKAPITTIADINGFLVVTMGQKVSPPVPLSRKLPARADVALSHSSSCAPSKTTSGS